nr:MAG TPA: hypothetical protein [Caudoviricetes sp.]
MRHRGNLSLKKIWQSRTKMDNFILQKVILYRGRN